MKAHLDWAGIDLVVFDVDGTLYDQRRLRMRMALQLMHHAIRSRSLALPRTLAAFRRHREWLGTSGAEDFATRQYAIGDPPERLRETVAEWIERRPLPYLAGCRYPGIEKVFRALAGRCTVAIFSDYPAAEKLAALGLEAHLVITANDVGRLKPDPSGLRVLMDRSGVPPSRTLVIGDRDDRDGEAARRAGVRALIRGRDFRNYTDRLFADAA